MATKRQLDRAAKLTNKRLERERLDSDIDDIWDEEYGISLQDILDGDYDDYRQKKKDEKFDRP